jgi:hypothetical protein
MSADKYFAYAAELLKVNPPHITDEPILAQMRRIGIVPGESFDFEKLLPAVRKALQSAPATAQALMKWKLPMVARVTNNLVDEHRYDGRLRKLLSQARNRRFGRHRSEPAGGRDLPLQSRRRIRPAARRVQQYTMHFEKGATPPARAFWSVTLYDQEGFQVANSLERFAVSSWMPFTYNADGSLDLYLQNESPGKDKEANWLPAPKGSFNLTMRLYAPGLDALTGRWNPPFVVKAQTLPSLGAQ